MGPPQKYFLGDATPLPLDEPGLTPILRLGVASTVALTLSTFGAEEMFLCSESGVGLSLIIGPEIVVVWLPTYATPAAGRIGAEVKVPLCSGGKWSVGL